MVKHLLAEMNWKEAEEALGRYDMAILPGSNVHPYGLSCPVGYGLFTSEEIASLVIASRALDNNPKQLTAVMMECLNLVQISDLNEEDVLPLHNLIKVYNS